jgi:hypothetical protein
MSTFKSNDPHFKWESLNSGVRILQRRRMMKTTVLFGVVALIVGLAFAAPAVVAQDKSFNAIALRLATIGDQFDRVLVLL